MSVNSTTSPAVAAAPYPGSRSTPRGGRVWTRVAGGVLVLAVLASIVTWGGSWLRLLQRTPVDSSRIHVVKPTTLNVTLREDGELKPVHSAEIKCDVQGGQGMQRGFTIKWVAPESTVVKQGDLIVELASEEIMDRVETESIEVTRLQASAAEAQQQFEITKSENASALQKAEIEVQVAEIELQRYLEGEYKEQHKSSEVSIIQAEIDLRQKEDELAKSRRLFEKGFVTKVKIQELEDSVRKAQLLLEKYNLEIRILDEYELRKNKLERESAVVQAKDELEREKKRGESRLITADTKLRDAEATLAQQQKRLDRLKEQLEKCRIVAPVDGLVQYGRTGGGRGWDETRIAAGQTVNPGQTLINIPDASQMMVATRIHEADRHKVREGLKCLVRVPAVPGRVFTGKITSVAKFADSERSWLNPNLKEHATEILLDETDPRLAPGDTAQVEILIEEVADVLAIPVQCVYARGMQRFVFTLEGGNPKPRAVRIGRATIAMVEVVDGVQNGDRVLMAPSEDVLALLPSGGPPGQIPDGLPAAPGAPGAPGSGGGLPVADATPTSAPAGVPPPGGAVEGAPGGGGGRGGPGTPGAGRPGRRPRGGSGATGDAGGSGAGSNAAVAGGGSAGSPDGAQGGAGAPANAPAGGPAASNTGSGANAGKPDTSGKGTGGASGG